MEGSYNKVFLARFNVPAESYLYFIDILLDTIREQIAACMSASYKSVTLAEATKLIFYDSTSKTTEFAQKMGWTCDGKIFRYSYFLETILYDNGAVVYTLAVKTYGEFLEKPPNFSSS